MKRLLLSMATPLFFISSLIGMEDKCNENKIIRRKQNPPNVFFLEKEQYPIFVSFVEAMMAGNCFCFDLDKATCRFKHFDEDGFYTLSFCDVSYLYEQYKIASRVLLAKTPGIYFVKKYGVILPKTLPEKSELCERELLIQWCRLSGFNNNECYRSNRTAFQKIIESLDFTNIDETCYKQTCRYKFTVRQCLENKLGALPEKQPKVGRVISFLDALFKKGPIVHDSENQRVIVPHFKKSEKQYYFSMNEIKEIIVDERNDKNLFELLVPYDYQKLCIALKSKFDAKGHDMLISSVEPKQRKRIVMLRSIFDFITDPLSGSPINLSSLRQRPRRINRSTNEDFLDRRLMCIKASKRKQLDGFEGIFPKEYFISPKEYLAYIKRIIARNKNRNALDNPIENLGELMQIIQKPLFLNYVPLKDACHQLEK